MGWIVCHHWNSPQSFQPRPQSQPHPATLAALHRAKNARETPRWCLSRYRVVDCGTAKHCVTVATTTPHVQPPHRATHTLGWLVDEQHSSPSQVTRLIPRHRQPVSTTEGLQGGGASENCVDTAPRRPSSQPQHVYGLGALRLELEQRCGQHPHPPRADLNDSVRAAVRVCFEPQRCACAWWRRTQPGQDDGVHLPRFE